jgi:hypothetical protein
VVPKLKSRVAIGAAALVVLAGAGGTYAATKGSGGNERQLFLDDVAKRLHVSTGDLESALKGALSDRLDAAVKAGRLTREQADEIKKRQNEEGGVPFLGPGKFRGHGPAPFLGGPPPHKLPIMAGLEASAKYLGLSDEQLNEQLESGKSLAQVAEDRDKSVDGLKDAIKAAVRSKLEAAVSDKRLTKAQEEQILDDIDRHLDDIVQRKGGGPPPIGRRGVLRPDDPGVPRFRAGPPWGGRP